MIVSGFFQLCGTVCLVVLHFPRLNLENETKQIVLKTSKNFKLKTLARWRQDNIFYLKILKRRILIILALLCLETSMSAVVKCKSSFLTSMAGGSVGKRHWKLCNSHYNSRNNHSNICIIITIPRLAVHILYMLHNY